MQNLNFPEYAKCLLNDKIQEAKWEAEVLHLQHRSSLRDLRDVLQSARFEGARQRAGEVVAARGRNHRQSLHNKLIRLTDNSKWDYSTNKVNNLSTYTLSREQLEVLNLGMGFCTGNNKADILKTISSINLFNFKHPEFSLDFMKGAILNNTINMKVINVLPKRHQLALESLKKNKDIMIMRADKGGATVVMNTSTYLDKAYALLNDTQTYTPLDFPPTATKMQQEFNRKLRKIANSLTDPQHKQLVASKISSKSPSVPYFYGIPKVHKPGCPLRPIVATCGSPQNNLATWLTEILSPFVGKFSDAHIQHSYQFIQRVKEIGNVEGRMISLDVTSLFTKVPLEFVLTKLKEEYDAGNLTLPIPCEQFFSLIRLCVSSTIFQFNNKGFAQKEGVAMGSPLSPVLANLCMEFVEREILNRCDIEIKPLLWVRYVDDIFIVFKGNEDQLKKLIDISNSILPSIKFTTEVEVDFKLFFLDVLVFRDCNNNNFKFSVYRKATNSESYIHFYSFHSNGIKSNIIMNFALRALRICEPEYLDSELNHIFATFRGLRYPSHFIERAISRARKIFYGFTNDCRDKPKRYLSLPFNPAIANLCKEIY